MTDNKNELVKEWYRFAMMDFSAAKYIYDNMIPKPLEIICYHCQQSAEKFLKGFLVANDIEPPRIHDLAQLRIMCAKISTDFEEIYDMCQLLNPYGVQPRYPDEIEISETDAETALQNVQAMIDFFEGQGINVKPKESQ
jgi:HEPN domain-containing protein